MDDDSKDSELHFFDVLRQPVYAGDVCMSIGAANKNSERYDALRPVLITKIKSMRKLGHFAYSVRFVTADPKVEYQQLIMKEESDSSDQFIKVNNPEFFIDSEPMAKILVKQSDLKNSLKR